MVLDKNEMVNKNKTALYSADSWLKEGVVCFNQLVVDSFAKEIVEISKKLISHFVILKITSPTLKQALEVKVYYKVELNIFK